METLKTTSSINKFSTFLFEVVHDQHNEQYIHNKLMKEIIALPDLAESVYNK